MTVVEAAKARRTWSQPASSQRSLQVLVSMSTQERPVVFFDISIGDVPVGRMKMELFSDIVPKTAENFR